MKNKADIRAEYLRIRNSISESSRQQAAILAAEYLVTHPVFKKSTHIACYCAHKNEFETIPIIQTIWRAGKKCYLPVLCEGKALSFVGYEDGDTLDVNQYGILEPFNFAKKIAHEKLDMVLMPLVAYDAMGARLGMGGGFYDRTFAFIYAQHVSPHLAGLAYTSQFSEDLPTDPWDIKLNSVITEQGIRNF